MNINRSLAFEFADSIKIGNHVPHIASSDKK